MKRPLRIAVLADTLPPRGHTGVGNSHYHLAGALRAAGMDARTYAFLEPPRALALAVKAPVRTALRGLGFLRRPWRAPGKALEFSNDLLGAFGGLGLLSALVSFAPDWVVAPDFGACAAFWPAGWRRRLVLVAHSNPLRFLDQPLIGRRDPWDARLAWLLESRMSAEAAAVVAPSRYMRAVFERDYPHRAGVRVIPNLMSEALIAGVRPARLPDGGVDDWVFVPAADNDNKGRRLVPGLLAGIARRLPGRRVGFVLSGPVRPSMRRALARLADGVRVHCPGPLPYAENLGLLKACGLCVSPTLIENFGMALLEAQFCGLPVLTFDVGGNAELVADGATGRVVPYLDAEALARESAALILDRPRMARWGRAAARRARREFSSRGAGLAYVRLLRSLPPR